MVYKDQWKINYDSPNSYHNFVEMLDLTCVPKNVIGFIGSAYFIGFAISAAIVPAIADNYGRKLSYLTSLFF